MSGSPLTHEEFFSRLAALFDANRTSNRGSVFLTQKRLSYGESQAAPSPAETPGSFADLNPAAPLPVLIRATNGKWKAEKGDKLKISTVVQPSEIEGFYTKYAEICKSGMSGLKKRDRSKRKKKKKGAGKG